eukprot:CAMPEP_0115025776 /NCGR_PEP_ID=MMETSP0216-20121206/34257_1 /TAXON_ID=223996 /ORGANISM="Protocruzia adherens, Strain Boccale" /LENGTH=66 /DNA_ID=CAMNT_0002400535 /DNA_START=78 /DNA_END=274 /DNA_ORIENTATION=+
MEVYREVNDVQKKIMNNHESIDDWRYYKYCTRLVGTENLIGVKDHFHPSIEAKLETLETDSVTRLT